MGDLKGAWEAAAQLKSREVWGVLCDSALHAMDVDLAIWVFRHQQAASMVMSLERIRHIEDKNLLAGHILVLKDGEYDAAQDLFMRSSYPKAALEMRRDLKHWEEAMKLAEQMDPDSIGSISRNYAGMLEVRGDYPAALDNYQQVQACLSPVPRISYYVDLPCCDGSIFMAGVPCLAYQGRKTRAVEFPGKRFGPPATM